MNSWDALLEVDPDDDSLGNAVAVALGVDRKQVVTAPWGAAPAEPSRVLVLTVSLEGT